MTRDQIIQSYEKSEIRFDGVIERTFVWIDIVCDPAKNNPSTFIFQPPFSFRYSEWIRHGNFISRYVYVTEG